MGSCISIAARFGVLAILLAGVGCNQRSAPIDLPSASPPPRAVQRAPQQTSRPPAPQPVRPRPVEPFDNRLPPPNANPTVSNVGTAQAAPVAPRPTPRPRVAAPTAPPSNRITDNPYRPFDPLDLPKAGPEPKAEVEEERITQQTKVDLPTEQAEASKPPATPETPSTPRASDDYASLLGDEEETPARAEAPQVAAPPAAQAQPTPAPGVSGKALVALLVPESDRRGSIRALADGLAKAASLAAADIDESKLELRKYDTGGDPRKAAQAAKNAIADGARLIIGPLFSGSAAAVRPIAQASSVNVIAFTTDQAVLGGGLYSIGFLPETDVKRMIRYSARSGWSDIALMVPNTPFGGVVTREARAAAGAVGANIVKAQPFRDDFKTLDTAATEFADYYKNAPNVDAVIIATNGRSLQGLAAYLAYRNVLPNKVKYMGLGLWDDKETFREGTLRGGWFPGVDPALKSDFSYRYGQAYGAAPPDIALLGYDAVAVAASLIREGGFTQQAILSPSGFSGMSGLFRFNRDGSNERALSILEVGDSSFKVVDPAPRSFSTQVSSLTGG